MAGIHSRSKYDECDIENILSISMNVGNYATSTDQLIESQACINNVLPMSTRVGRVSTLDQTNAMSLTDIESHLRNIDMPASNCSVDRTMDAKTMKANKLIEGLSRPESCAVQMTTANTRLDIPATMYREATFNRFDFPIIPPSHFVYNGITGTEQVDNNRSGVNTRLQAKDNFRYDK